MKVRHLSESSESESSSDDEVSAINNAATNATETNDESSSDDEDDDSESESDSDDDILLPDPTYGEETKTASFGSLEELALFVDDVEPLLQKELVEHDYNAVGSFVRFYKAYQSCRDVPLEVFFKEYNLQITDEHYTCVGLSIDLLKNLQSALCGAYPNIVSRFFVASCEEEYTGPLSEYTRFSPPPSYFVLKEHVVVVLKFVVEGRSGCVLLDPGYHISKPLIIMADGLYPHTGWFVQDETPKSMKEYNYRLIDEKYVLWEARETRGQRVSFKNSLIYVHQKFENYIDYTERRNLVYHFRVLVKRNKKGQLTSGFYFPLKADAHFTIFFHTAGLREEFKIPLDYFLHAKGDNVEFERAVRLCGDSLKMKDLRELCVEIANIVHDSKFLEKVLHIDTQLEEDD